MKTVFDAARARDTMAGVALWIYLSPHLDDAALSCGGQIALRARKGETVQVLTVFAGVPKGALSPFAQALHRRWGLGQDAPAARQAEDREALRLLGASPIHWGLPECIYRQASDGTFLYADEASLWGPLHPADGALLDAIARRIAALPPPAFLCVPLGAGRHVDHRLVRLAAEEGWERVGRPLLYYEDYPYAEDPHAVGETLEGEGWKPLLFPLDEEALEAKAAAVSRYRSQISTFWADAKEAAGRLRAYGWRIGGDRPAERVWWRLRAGEQP